MNHHLNRFFTILAVLLSLGSGYAYADKKVSNTLGIYMTPEVENHVCLSLEEKSGGEVNKTDCQLKMKYVNEICLEEMSTNFSETVSDDLEDQVIAEFSLCRLLSLLGEDYEFGMGKHVPRRNEK